MPRRRLLFLIAPLVIATALRAQDAPAAGATQFWLTAGGGPGWAWHDQNFPSHSGGAALAGAFTLQRHMLVASVRATRTHSDLGTLWDAGILAGVGSSPVPAVRGSVAVGLGLAGTPHGATHLAFPVEVQLTWRLAPSLGIGSYLYGSYRQTDLALGAAFGVVVGRLR